MLRVASRLALVFLCLSLVTPAGVLHAAADCAAPLTLFTARTIVTMEPALPEAGVVAVQGDRIVAVGRDLADLRAWTDNCPHRVDDRFADDVLMPGMIDPHLHPMLAAVLLPSVFITPDDWTLPRGEVAGVRTPEAWRERLREALANAPGGEPLVTWGWHERWHGPLDRAALDALAPDRPLVVWQRSFHEIIVNSAAVELMGFAADAESPGALPEAVSPDHVRLAEGHFLETGLSVAMARLAPVLFAPQRIAGGLADMARMAHAGGITTMADMALGLNGDPLQEAALLTRTFERDEVPFRLLLVPHLRALETHAGADGDVFAYAESLRTSVAGHRVFVRRHLKLLVDGAFFSQLMQMGPPGYADGHHGEWLTPPDALRAGAAPFWDAGWDIHAHANGDAGVAVMLDLIEDLQQRSYRADHRTSLEHFGYSTEDQNRRLARLGLVVSAQPWYVHVLSGLYGRSGMGWDRASQMARLGSLERKGVPVALHSDLTMAPARPLLLAWAAATRENMEGEVMAPMERLSLDAALRAITIDAAFVLRMEDEIGSIRAGKRADFTVLDADPRVVGAEGLRDIVVRATVFEGRVFPVEGS